MSTSIHTKVFFSVIYFKHFSYESVINFVNLSIVILFRKRKVVNRPPVQQITKAVFQWNLVQVNQQMIISVRLY